jgi:hypothetical protein
VQCQQQFGVTLRPNWCVQKHHHSSSIIHHSPFVAGDYELTCLCRARIQFGGFNLTSSSNIIFSNGLLGTYYHLAERVASG